MARFHSDLLEQLNSPVVVEEGGEDGGWLTGCRKLKVLVRTVVLFFRSIKLFLCAEVFLGIAIFFQNS
jgi:hypothetical protein